MNLKRIKNNIIVAILFCGVLASCTDFGNTNVDPNLPSNPETTLLLTGVLRNISSYIYDEETPLYYVQHISATQYASGSRYETTTFSFYDWYSGPLADLQLIIDLNTDPATAEDVQTGGSNSNQIAVAMILKAYFYQVITDAWGMAPYSEALQGTDQLTPAYDSQETIYTGLMSDLEEAVGMITSTGAISGDILFNGDMDRWKRFANTLRMNMALRLAEITPTIASSEFVEAMNADGGIITSDVAYTYLAQSSNDNPWYDRFLTRKDHAISEPLLNYMSEINDPRIPIYADPSDASVAAGSPEYVGMPYGLTDGDAGAIPYEAVSLIGTELRQQETPGYLFTMSQVYFDKAEAAYRGWISDDAEQLYYDAIRASFDQFGVVYTEAEFNNYISQPGVAWEESNAIQRIGEQKWIALYLNPFEAWSEWRRLDYPELEPAPASSESSVPVRYPYTPDEAELNEENFNSAVSDQGGNTLSTPVWWDVD